MTCQNMVNINIVKNRPGPSANDWPLESWKNSLRVWYFLSTSWVSSASTIYEFHSQSAEVKTANIMPSSKEVKFVNTIYAWVTHDFQNKKWLHPNTSISGQSL
jgi:hypothetical protein